MLKLVNVSKYYNTDGNVALGLKKVNVELYQNEIVAIVGESGSGKTTFLNVISGVDTYEEGEIYFNGEETSYFSNEDYEKFRKDNVGFIYQNYNLVDSYTVLENVMMPLILKGVNKKEAKRKAIEIIKRVGLEKRMRNRSIKLSGGEKQRCVIARALASDSLILACDEPTGNLDSKTGKEIISLIKEVSKDKLVLIVTHNYDEVKDIATRKLRFYDGELVEDKVLVQNECKENIIEREEYKLKFNDLIYYAWKNIISTPKKSIFILLVFLTLSLIITNGVQGILSSNVDGGYIDNRHNLNDCIMVSNDGNFVDVNKLKELDDFAFAMPFSNIDYIHDLNMMAYNDNYYFSGWLDFTERYNYKLIAGTFPNNDNEVCVSSNNENVIGQEINIDGWKYKISGIIQEDNIILKQSQYQKFFRHYYFNGDTCFTDNEIVKIGISDGDIIYIYGYDNIDDVDFYINNVKVDFLNSGYEVVFDYDDTSKWIEIPSSFICDFYMNTGSQGYMLFVNGNVKNNIQEIKNMGYFAYDYSAHKDISLDYFINFLSFVMSVIGFCFMFLIIYFISYVVLFFVQGSRKKDYTIMRSLGILKPNMKAIVSLEMLFHAVISYILFVVIIGTINLFHKLTGFELITDPRIFGMLGSLGIMIILGLLLARGFNKRLFKNSINQTLKKEDL